MTTGAAASAAATAGARSSGGASRASRLATSATHAATSPPRSNTTETVGVAAPGRREMRPVLSLQGAGRQARSGGEGLAAATGQVCWRRARQAVPAFAAAGQPHPSDRQCCSSAVPARSSPTADTSSGSGGGGAAGVPAPLPPPLPAPLPADFSSRASASAMLRATPPAARA